MRNFWLFCFFYFSSFCESVGAQVISTNSVQMFKAPKWVKLARVNQVTDRIERALEWQIRKVRVVWHEDDESFRAAHGLSDASDADRSVNILAVTKGTENTIHMSRQVNPENFEGVLGHELAHIILMQKYKDSIPKWLEEGLANKVAGRGVVDYQWLSQHEVQDVRQLSHPFGNQGVDVKTHYMASTALIQMIAQKCRLADLLQLAVGQKLENYLQTFCGIKDLNLEYRKWVRSKLK